MVYQEQLPSKELCEIIQNYWRFEVLDDKNLQFPIVHETLPENTMSLVLIDQPYFKGTRLMGPHTSKYSQSLMPDSVFLGIKIQPWITIDVLSANMVSIVNTTCEVPKDFETQFKNLDIKALKTTQDFQVVESRFKKLLNNLNIQKNDMVKFICLNLDKGEPIASVITQIPVSTRVIQKKFKEVTGITMKQYANVSRQRNTWKAIVLEHKDTLDAILEHGFFDQSHFINEFRKLMNRSHNDFQSYLSSVSMTFQ